MKQENGRMVHVSFDTVERFVPRVPQNRSDGEDDKTKRICVAPNLISALQAVPQSGTVLNAMMEIGLPLIIHAYYLKSKSVMQVDTEQVPDSMATG